MTDVGQVKESGKKKAEEYVRAGLKQKSLRITNVIIEAMINYDLE